MSKIRTFIECFVTVTTGIVLIAACTYHSQPEALTSMTLWQILLSAALCALSTTLFFPEEYPGKVRFWMGIGLHFVSLCAIMIVCGRWFGWVGPTAPDALIMVLYVVLVYGFTLGVTYLIERKQVTDMNRQLKKKYGKEAPEETE